MKDLLEEKINMEVKIVLLHYMQVFYEGRMDFSVYSDIIAKTNATKKKLITLVQDTADLTVREQLQSQMYPYKFYIEKVMTKKEKEDEGLNLPF